MSHAHHTSPENDHQTDDAYLTIAARKETEIKILGSRFLSYATPCGSIGEFMDFLENLRKTHYDATHHCFACRTGYDGGAFRFSDDGEPGGTAGKRILGSMDRLSLTDMGIVVVRYFGGTKLGVGGLARAYGDAANAVLEQCTVETRFLTDTFILSFPYDMTSQVHHALDKHAAEVVDRKWLDQAEYTVRVRRSHREQLLTDIAEFTQRLAAVRGESEARGAKS